ncbi:FliH/SctL family protein [Pseudorhodoferax sp.]|uniref:FliH/SctL family protein n=1 Tax=Pseudorhodoferax sp. TaxID=1993553 RepID=UPI002DD66F28|nr:flagellar assembly protein FliH [Pseudorhodoferax sp.]
MSTTRHRMYTRFIPGEEIGAVAAWTFGRLGEPEPEPLLEMAPPEPEPEPQPEPEPEEARLQRAYDAGHAAGYATGHADAARVGHEQLDAYVGGQGRENAARLAASVQQLQQRLAECEQRQARQVLELAAELARQVVRRELATRPDAVLPVVREALALLGAEHKAATVRLHPADLEVVAAALREEHAALDVRWSADATVERGGCLVEAGGTVVDGQLPARWRRALAQLGLDAPWEQEGGDA